MLVYVVKIEILVVVLSFQFNKMCDSGQFPRLRPREEGEEERPGSVSEPGPGVCVPLFFTGVDICSNK